MSKTNFEKFLENTDLILKSANILITEELSKKQKKIARVMGEFKDGKLKDRGGKTVTNRKQAIAIALSYNELEEIKNDALAELLQEEGQFYEESILSNAVEAVINAITNNEKILNKIIDGVMNNIKGKEISIKL